MKNIGKRIACCVAVALPALVMPVCADEHAGRSAIPALQKARPAVRWDRQTERRADITCDGRPDRIAVGYGRDGSVWVGVLPTGGRIVTRRFPVADASQAAFCAIPVSLQVYARDCSAAEDGRLPGCSDHPACAAFAVTDERCDALHFYWHVEDGKLLWWRR